MEKGDHATYPVSPAGEGSLCLATCRSGKELPYTYVSTYVSLARLFAPARRLAGGIPVGRKIIQQQQQQRRPNSQIPKEEIYDEYSVAKRFFRQGVELGKGIINGQLGKVVGTIMRVLNFVEVREVQSHA
ncbi:hypothetical protein FALCPG4_015200 [Fusarium falciforme]